MDESQRDREPTSAPGPAPGDGRGPGLLAWVYAGVVVLFGGSVCSVWAFGVFYGSEPGVDRLREMAWGLVLSAVFGVGVVALARGLTQRRVWSPWLLLGVLPAGIAALNHAGITGTG